MEGNFIADSILLGVGLATDAFSVSIADGLQNPRMRRSIKCKIAGVFAGFQFAMPLIGWVCVHTAVKYFTAFEKWIPWIALILLGFIGGKMLFEGFNNKTGDHKKPFLDNKVLIIQGIATSIDALSCGFAFADYNAATALSSCAVIAVVTFIICLAGLFIGVKFGSRLSGRAQILGGIILIAIGLEIFFS